MRRKKLLILSIILFIFTLIGNSFGESKKIKESIDISNVPSYSSTNCQERILDTAWHTGPIGLYSCSDLEPLDGNFTYSFTVTETSYLQDITVYIEGSHGVCKIIITGWELYFDGVLIASQSGSWTGCCLTPAPQWYLKLPPYLVSGFRKILQVGSSHSFRLDFHGSGAYWGEQIRGKVTAKLSPIVFEKVAPLADTIVAIVSEPLSEYLKVKLTNCADNLPVPNETVTFTLTQPNGAGGKLRNPLTGQEGTSVNSVTDASGIASVEMIVGSKEGQYIVNASCVSIGNIYYTIVAQDISIKVSEIRVTDDVSIINDNVVPSVVIDDPVYVANFNGNGQITISKNEPILDKINDQITVDISFDAHPKKPSWVPRIKYKWSTRGGNSGNGEFTNWNGNFTVNTPNKIGEHELKLTFTIYKNTERIDTDEIKLTFYTTWDIPYDRGHSHIYQAKKSILEEVCVWAARQGDDISSARSILRNFVNRYPYNSPGSTWHWNCHMLADMFCERMETLGFISYKVIYQLADANEEGINSYSDSHAGYAEDLRFTYQTLDVMIFTHAWVDVGGVFFDPSYNIEKGNVSFQDYMKAVTNQYSIRNEGTNDPHCSPYNTSVPENDPNYCEWCNDSTIPEPVHPILGEQNCLIYEWYPSYGSYAERFKVPGFTPLQYSWFSDDSWRQPSQVVYDPNKP